MKKNQLLNIQLKSFLVFLLVIHANWIIAQHDPRYVFVDKCKGLQMADPTFANINSLGFINWGYRIHDFDVDIFDGQIYAIVSTAMDSPELIKFDPITEKIESILVPGDLNYNDLLSFDSYYDNVYIYNSKERNISVYEIEKKLWTLLVENVLIDRLYYDMEHNLLIYSHGSQLTVYGLLPQKQKEYLGIIEYSIDYIQGYMWIKNSQNKTYEFDYYNKITIKNYSSNFSQYQFLEVLYTYNRRLLIQKNFYDSIQNKLYYNIDYFNSKDELFYPITQLNCRIEKLKNILIKSSTAINNEEKKVGIQLDIFPQPADNIVSIKIPNDYYGICNIAITDLFGRIIMSKTDKISNGHLQIDLSHLIPGSYGIRITTGQNVHSAMMIKN